MYRVLYRKWRPQVFADVVGQPHITSTLSAEVRENRLAHAYLFTGSRGTGKTTCAKILAKAVNCLHPVNGDPCNECEICKGIDSGTILDIVEIDAASNRGIDDIRVLRDESNFTPSMAKFRVYIIDEVHMLTIEAFNALLKTLEEPPEHVKFILATTEVHKLPSTILSRCQRFDFRRIEPAIIADRLEYVAAHEDCALDREAALLIARIADGGMRDALSLLDSCISVSPKVTVDVVYSSAGLMGREHVYRLIEAVAAGDTAEALRILDELHAASCDTARLLNELTDQFRNFLIIKTVSDPSHLIVSTDEELARLKKLSESFTREQVLFSMNVLTATAAALQRSANRRVEAEMALIRLCSPENDGDAAALASRIAKLEAQVRDLMANGVRVAAQPAPAYKPEPGPEPHPEPQPESKPENQPAPVKQQADFNGFREEKPAGGYMDLFSPDEETDDLPMSEEELEALALAEALPDPEEDPPFVPDTPPSPAAQIADLPFGPDSSAPAPSPAKDPQKPDPDFDFDKFMEDYTGKTGEEIKAEDESRRASGEDAVPTKTWLQIILAVERAFSPLNGKFTGSSAYVRGGRLYIRPMSPMIKMSVPDYLLERYVAPAVKEKLGKELTVLFE